MTLPAPPYTYNDPRLLYNEVCFFYDGGYDSVCLTGSIFVGRAKTNAQHAKERKKRKELEKEKLDKTFINIFIESKLLSVNGDLIKPDEESKWYRFSGETDIVEIYVNDIKIDISKPMIEGKFIETIKRIVSYSGSLESNEVLKESLKVSSSFYITTKSNEPPLVVEKNLEPEDDFKIDCTYISHFVKNKNE